MRNKLIKYYVAVVYLFSTSLLFADPGTETTDGSLDILDAPTAPIDSYVWLLMGIGIVFMFFKFKQIKNQSKT